MIKLTKQERNNFIVIALIFVAIMYFGFFKPLSLLPLPVQTETTVWDEINVELSSPTFSSITDDDSFRYCDGNSISNSYFSGDKLTISSNMQSELSNCGSNYVKAVMTLPSGTLSVKCKYGFSIGDSGYLNEVKCEIPKLDYSSGINDVKTNMGLGGWYNGFICPNGGCSLNCPGTYCPLDSQYKDVLNLEKEYVIESPTKIEVWVRSNVDEGGANAEITLDFDKTEVIVYVIENNQCRAVTISPDGITGNYFESLEQCSSYLDSNGNNGNGGSTEPPEQPPEENKMNYWLYGGLISILLIILIFVYVKTRR